MKSLIENPIKRLPLVKQLYEEIQQLHTQLSNLQSSIKQYQLGWPPGHFYSPIPSIEKIKDKEAEIFENIPKEILGVEINAAEQLSLLTQFKSYYAQQPFKEQKTDNLRYFFDNPNFSYGEAIIFYSMIRHIKPKKIIEIGSGYSSCVMLDTNEIFFNNEILCTFIEPYPELLLSLIKHSDVDRIKIIPNNLQDIELSNFSSLNAGDILFIDSTHVSKIDSDVNHIFFRILPHIKSGVYIHLHDIYYPFEYPKEWVYQGRAWNEAYLLRAFLQYNSAFKIVYFNSFIGHLYRDKLLSEMPLCGQHAGSSIWIKKI
ncbi:MAG: class I SAM-dependent methyltransferase [Aulosira sp. DedQUE10]|nr:class I SAM-dependent methyltransferase [Aulosira sp. DedQUE10]